MTSYTNVSAKNEEYALKIDNYHRYSKHIEFHQNLRVLYNSSLNGHGMSH